MNADIALDEAKRYLCGRHFGRDARMSGHQATSVFLFKRIARKNHEFCFTTIFLSDGVIPCDRVLTAGDQTKRQVSKRCFFQIVVAAQECSEPYIKRVGVFGVVNIATGMHVHCHSQRFFVAFHDGDNGRNDDIRAMAGKYCDTQCFFAVALS